MKNVGIVAEYNPFHTGHLLHIEQTRQLLGENTGIVCVMSGNFVQRGEAAIYEKHARARAAVLSGVDLVLELPIPYALSSAEGFAFGAVSLLDSLKCVDFISFGSEVGDVSELEKTASLLLDPVFDDALKDELSHGVSYASARQRAAERLSKGELSILKAPNNILGIEYIKALRRLKSTIKPVTFMRIGVGHDEHDVVGGIASASYLREMLKASQDISSYIPVSAALVFNEAAQNGFGPVFNEALETAVLSRLRAMTREEFEALPDASEGLGLRLMKFARLETGVNDILIKVKTKRYAYSRIKRMIMCAFLSIGVDSKPERPTYARVLACNMRGRSIIRQIDKGIPVITKPAEAKKLEKTARDLFELEARATDLYVLAFPDKANRAGGQEWTIGPEIL